EKFQTPFTPNVLGIYLMMRVMEKFKPIKDVDKTTRQRFKSWETFFSQHKHLQLLIENPKARSYTVLAIKSEPSKITSIKKTAKQKGFILGEGYGDLKTSTFRIANFPAIKLNEIAALQKFLKAV
ncbi:MAG: alanine--glyoxylate aminotransferase family protein, partial [Flammeovirgaceae bacterium]|nr:alanine--glyoxylate aminotransferase family protein [Flammeovirgaceae bacterium]